MRSPSVNPRQLFRILPVHKDRPPAWIISTFSSNNSHHFHVTWKSPPQEISLRTWFSFIQQFKVSERSLRKPRHSLRSGNYRSPVYQSYSRDIPVAALLVHLWCPSLLLWSWNDACDIPHTGLRPAKSTSTLFLMPYGSKLMDGRVCRPQDIPPILNTMDVMQVSNMIQLQ